MNTSPWKTKNRGNLTFTLAIIPSSYNKPRKSRVKRPTFFLSSTIYDFRDLRSALKFFLEEQGCKVLASEFNDFDKPLDGHSYEACLRSIHSADYFILVIGRLSI